MILGKHINHPNILSIKGVLPHLSQFCAVSEWMVNGDVLQYITKCPGVNHLELVCPELQYLIFYSPEVSYSVSPVASITCIKAV